MISNDSDLVMSIQEARTFGVVVGIAAPVLNRRYPQRELVAAADFNVHLNRHRKHLLRSSQFPNVLNDAAGEFRKPATW